MAARCLIDADAFCKERIPAQDGLAKTRAKSEIVERDAINGFILHRIKIRQRRILAQGLDGGF